MATPLCYESGKVGDDIPLQISLTDNEGAPRAIESARITIVDGNGENVLNDVPADQVSSSTAQYVFTPSVPSAYLVEWHLIYGGGLNKYVRDIQLRVGPRHAP